MTSVHEINDLAGLASLRLAWAKLLNETRGATYFHTLDWLETYWRHYGEGQRLRVVVVKNIHEILGIAPFVTRPESTRLGTVRTLTWPLHDWGSFYGPIGHDPTATLIAALGHIRETKRDWDLLDLRWIDPTIDHGRTRDSLASAGFRPRLSSQQPVALVELTGDWKSYLASRAAKWRQNLRRSERLLCAEGQLEHVRYRPAGAALGDEDPRWDLYEACETLAAESWQGSSNTGTTMSHASIRAFLRDAHLAAVRAGALDLNLLKLDGQPVAFGYNYVWRGSIFGLRTGYLPRASNASAGAVMMARMLEDSFERGDTLFDLGPNYLEVKRPWLTQVVPQHRYLHYPRLSWRANALRIKRWLAGERAAHAAWDWTPNASQAGALPPSLAVQLR